MVAAPAGLKKAEALLDAQKTRGELDALLPRQFHSLQKGRGTTYVESISKDGEMSEVFLAQNNTEGGEAQQLVVILADRGFQKKNDPEKAGYLVLDKGYRIQGVPGQADYQITEFSEHGIKLSKPRPYKRVAKADTLPTGELMNSDQLRHQAAVHWRLSVPLLVLIISLLAVPLSKTNPRQGRFAKMFPAMLAYVVYLVALNAARGGLEDGKIPIQLGLWPVHGVFLMAALGLLGWPIFQQHRKQQREKLKTSEGER